MLKESPPATRHRHEVIQIDGSRCRWFEDRAATSSDGPVQWYVSLDLSSLPVVRRAFTLLPRYPRMELVAIDILETVSSARKHLIKPFGQK
jgi:hypothetical protein